MRRVILIIAMLAVIGIALMVTVGNHSGDNMGMIESRQMRTLTPEQLLTRLHRLKEPLRLRTAEDVLPGGYAAAMAPVMIDWEASRPWDQDGFVIIHNLNHGGNPVDGTTVFCSARIPLEGVEAAELTLLPLDRIGKEGLIQHGQLRFIFAKDQPVQLLNYGDKAMGSDSRIWDLVVSWEAWRPPDAGYDVMTGMDPESYLLTPRTFSGPQRFLDDALGKRDWFSHRLRLPGGHEGLVELLKTNLALCDGVARHAVSRILDQNEQEWARLAPRADGDPALTVAEWQELRQALAPRPVTTDTLINLTERDLAYQTLLRSCATMALYTINVAVDRLIARGLTDGLDLEHRMLPDLGHQEPWMTELADTDLKGIFLRAPTALRFLRANPQALPRNIPRQLRKAGLLELEDGKTVKLHYRLDGVTPYGTLQENLIK